MKVIATVELTVPDSCTMVGAIVTRTLRRLEDSTTKWLINDVTVAPVEPPRPVTPANEMTICEKFFGAPAKDRKPD